MVGTKRTERVDPMPIEDNDDDNNDDDRGDHYDDSRTSSVSESPLKKKMRHNREKENEDEKEGCNDMDNKNATVSTSAFVAASFAVNCDKNDINNTRNDRSSTNSSINKEDKKEEYIDKNNKNAAAATSFVTAAFAVDRDANNDEFDDNDEVETDNNDNDSDDVSIQAKTRTKKRNNKKERILFPYVYGVPYDSWDDMFERLAAYKKEHNSANVPKGYSLDKKLATWVTTQRTSYKNKELSADQMNRLELIGFVWKFVYQKTWEESFQRLVAHYKSKPPQQDESKNLKTNTVLGRWVKIQRKSYEKETLSIEHINRLEAIGFVWVVETLDYDGMWTARFEKYLAYRKENNTSSIPKKADPSLTNWMAVQRSHYKSKHKSLSVDRINRLQSAGFVLDLQQNKKQHKKLSIDPLKRLKSESDGVVVVAVVARDATKNLQAKRSLLWDTVFQQLITYKDEHKGCVNVSKRGAHAKLGRWVMTQRVRYKKEELSPDRITRLESIGFVWDFKDRVDENWMEMYNKLLMYKQEHKDCNVPRKNNKDLKLAIWVKNKRFYYNYNNTGRYKLSPKQLHLLNDINFFDSPIVCI